MLKKMFSRSSSNRQKFQPNSQTRSPVQEPETSSVKTTKNETVAGDALNKAERQLYQFNLPSNEQGFDDLVKEYTEGTRFQYVALSGKDEETYSARIRRLVTATPRIGKEALPQSKLPQLKLYEDTEQFNLSLAVPKKGKQYIRLSSVMAYYCPLVSSFSEFTKVSISLHDSRLLSKTCVQSADFNSNITQKVELSLDYCIPRTSCSKITLNIAREQKFLQEGEEWATVQLLIRLEESDFPYSSNLKEVTAVMALPPAVLDSYNVNPNHIDTTIVETQRRKIRDMYESGDIADENEPIKERLGKVSYAKSSVAPKVKGHKTNKSFGSGWEGMQFRDPLVPKDQVSDNPSDDGDLSIPELHHSGEIGVTADDVSSLKGKGKMEEHAPLYRNFHGDKSKKQGVSFNEFEV
uniref:Movement protein n=1 Tax=Citrus concave gum-associated virus TaxID=2024604 RepID=A0A514Y921_9VIRU|nr:movement protein [Citrus concave gum-associated virus]QDK54402.1 movement protein [Citrus concave gum-associated virus]WBB27566.1 movement protein [Citrus concave gum-associated virus]